MHLSVGMRFVLTETSIKKTIKITGGLKNEFGKISQHRFKQVFV